jgi:hypothetical protein
MDLVNQSETDSRRSVGSANEYVLCFPTEQKIAYKDQSAGSLLVLMEKFLLLSRPHSPQKWVVFLLSLPSADTG